MTVYTDFRMCKYCGGIIRSGYDAGGRKREDGDYCNPKCARACHGFDREMIAEQTHRTEPWREDHEALKTDDHPTMLAADADCLKRLAPAIDGRLPDILHWIADGWTQAQIAERLGINQQRVSAIVKRLRATL